MRRFEALAILVFFLLLVVALASCGGRASAPALVSLPEDDAPHSDMDTEWWYYHGHLNTAFNERYAFHFVVFQVRIQDYPPINVAHLSISDLQKHIYMINQKVSLATPGHKGTPGFAFDIGGWRMTGYGGHDLLTAFTDDYAFDLDLQEEKPPVLHQGTGLVSLGEAGESYYYSRTRLVVSGTVSVGSAEVPVAGLAWFDHQWGDFDPRPIGWDWFALQLSDGSDVMLSIVRDESDQPFYGYGTFVTPNGTVKHLTADGFQVSSTASWTSPASGAEYPAGWRVIIPAQGVDIALMPVIDECEFDATSTTRNYYWEGEVTVSGSHSGNGFVELTGYAQSG